MKKQLTTFILDFITIPSLFMSNKNRAQYHIKFVCPHCPEWRRKMTDVEDIGDCYWHHNWEKGNYNIPRTFGIKNWILRLIFTKTDLTNYNKPSSKQKTFHEKSRASADAPIFRGRTSSSKRKTFN